jgi:hypothetical protein
LPEDDVRERKGPKSFKKFADAEQMNLITTVDGEWTMFVSQFKNSSSFGVDTTALSEFQWWTELLEQYLNEGYRNILVPDDGNKHRYLFVTRSGDLFQPGYFSEFISGLLYKHTKVRVATNILRSSFITHFYNSPEASNPALQESVAKVMRHSVQQAQRTYDRRTSNARKQQGLKLLGGLHSQPHGLPQQSVSSKRERDVDKTPVQLPIHRPDGWLKKLKAK